MRHHVNSIRSPIFYPLTSVPVQSHEHDVVPKGADPTTHQMSKFHMADSFFRHLSFLRQI